MDRYPPISNLENFTKPDPIYPHNTCTKKWGLDIVSTN